MYALETFLHSTRMFSRLVGLEYSLEVDKNIKYAILVDQKCLVQAFSLAKINSSHTKERMSTSSNIEVDLCIS